MRIKILTGILAGILCLARSFSQSDPGAASARIYALAAISSTVQGIDAVYANPAGLINLEHTAFQLGSARSFGLSPLSQANAAMAFCAGDHGVIFTHLGQFGFSAYEEHQMGFGYALEIAASIRAAMSLELMQIAIEGYGSVMIPGVVIGLQYQPDKHLVLGSVVRNPFQLVNAEKLTLPSTLALGAAYHAGDHAGVYIEVEKDVDFPPRLKLAVEYELNALFSLRLGAGSNPGSFHTGFGLKIRDNLRLDFGSGYHRILGFTPVIGITFATL